MKGKQKRDKIWVKESVNDDDKVKIAGELIRTDLAKGKRTKMKTESAELWLLIYVDSSSHGNMFNRYI